MCIFYFLNHGHRFKKLEVFSPLNFGLVSLLQPSKAAFSPFGFISLFWRPEVQDQVPVELVLARAASWLRGGCLFHVTSYGRRGSGELWGGRGLFIRAPSAFVGLRPQDLVTIQRPRLLTPSHSDLGFNIRICRDTNM